MKVLVVSISDSLGGGAIGALRMHKGLLSAGVDSTVLVQQKRTNDYRVIGPKTNIKKVFAFLRPYIDLIPVFLYRKKTKFVFSPAILPDNIPAVVKKHNPDIVHLRWVCGGMLRIESLKKINKPIVWTLSDSWAFTGGCHLHFDCKKYLDSCGACPELGSNKENDLSRKIWNRKKKSWGGLNIVIVTASNWLTSCAKSSSLFKNNRVEVITNGLDLNIFKPIDKKTARNILNLPQDKKLILFGAANSTSDPNKGFKYLCESLDILKSKFSEDTELVVFGSSKPKDAPDFGFRVHYMGFLHDEPTLVLLYSACDVFVAPSLQETFGYTVLEAQACGTPVVAFAVGGIVEIVENRVTGYLSKEKDAIDLANGIDWVLSDEDRFKKLSKSSVERVSKFFDAKKQADAYIDLYNEILK